MMSAEWANAAVAASSLFLLILGGLAAWVWRIADREGKVRGDLHRKIDENHAIVSDKIDAIESRVGEVGAALRQKIHEVEMNTEREFVKNVGFDTFRTELREDMKRIFDKLDEMSRT